MKAYSLDLRQKIVDAVDNHLGTYEEIAEIFGVHVSFIYKLLRRRRETGSIAPAPHGGGVQPRLDQAALEVLSELVFENPDATLEELRTGLNKKINIDVSIMTISRGLKKLDITLKKRRASPRKPTLRNESSSRKSSQS